MSNDSSSKHKKFPFTETVVILILIFVFGVSALNMPFGNDSISIDWEKSENADDTGVLIGSWVKFEANVRPQLEDYEYLRWSSSNTLSIKIAAVDTTVKVHGPLLVDFQPAGTARVEGSGGATICVKVMVKDGTLSAEIRPRAKKRACQFVPANIGNNGIVHLY